MKKLVKLILLCLIAYPIISIVFIIPNFFIFCPISFLL